ncbi:replication initiation protein [Streptococcus sp. zg-JUN1979]|uniref:replication initiation protein n=1 Tax=Streptococcus sp. zg-JUN1979 TaxID=3391450 RepID=UPI0039B06034
MVDNSLIINSDKSYFDVIRPRESFNVYKANILAQAQGNLSTSERNILDYFLTFIKKDDVYDKDKMYVTTLNDLTATVGNVKGGSSGAYILKILTKLPSKTSILIPNDNEKNGKIIKGFDIISLFHKIHVEEDGTVAFAFHELLEPFLYGLSDGKFFTEELSNLLKLRSQYARTLYELYLSKRYATNKITVIEGSLEEWYLWLLGDDIVHDPEKMKHWTAGRFKQKILMYSIDKIMQAFPNIDITVEPIKKGRKVVAYKVTFILSTYMELKALNEAIENKRAAENVDEALEKEYMEKIMAEAINKNITLSEAAARLKLTKEITFIPSQLAPESK